MCILNIIVGAVLAFPATRNSQEWWREPSGEIRPFAYHLR